MDYLRSFFHVLLVHFEIKSHGMIAIDKLNSYVQVLNKSLICYIVLDKEISRNYRAKATSTYIVQMIHLNNTIHHMKLNCVLIKHLMIKMSHFMNFFFILEYTAKTCPGDSLDGH